MSNFVKRTLTGALFLIVMIGGIMWNRFSMFFLFLLIAILGLNEFYVLIIKSGKAKPLRLPGLLVGLLIYTVITNYAFIGDPNIPVLLYLSTLLSASLFIIELFHSSSTPFQNIALTLTGIIYIVVPLALWVKFSLPGLHLFDCGISPYRPHILMGFFILLWTNDTSAYLTGITIGKHKLWERISPKKTWEGFIGGMIFTAGIAILISHYYSELSTPLWIITGIMVTVFGTMGDMVESALKRSLDIKDSGGLLPGHGGILDRFDGVFLSTPFVLAFIHLIFLIDIITQF